MTDEQRTDSIGCYGSPWARTPTIDRLANAGVRFTAAVTPSPICLSARTSILYGQYPHQTGVWTNAVPDHPGSSPPLTSVLEGAGYRTASFGKQHYIAPSPAFQVQGFHVLTDEVGYFSYRDGLDHADYDVVRYPGEQYQWIFAGRFPADPSATSEAKAVEAAKAWLADGDPEQPFLLRVSFNGPHTPVVPPAPFDTCIDPDTIGLPPAPDDLPAEAPLWLHALEPTSAASRLSAREIRRMRQAYYGEVAYLDGLIDDLLRWMDGCNLLDDLVIAFVSDHGTHLGDYGLVQKNTFFEPVVNVPYFFSGAGVAARPDPVDTPVETRSLIPTLLDLVGLDVPEDRRETSLGSVVGDGAEVVQRPVFSEITYGELWPDPNDRFVMVRDGSWKLGLCVDPEPRELFLVDLESDPTERTNRAGDTDGDVSAMRDRLVELAAAHVGPRR